MAFQLNFFTRLEQCSTRKKTYLQCFLDQEHFEEDGSSEHFEEDGSGEQFEEDGSGEQFEEDGSGEQFEDNRSGEQFEDDKHQYTNVPKNVIPKILLLGQ
jgi:hypothetical protein